MFSTRAIRGLYLKERMDRQEDLWASAFARRRPLPTLDDLDRQAEREASRTAKIPKLSRRRA